MQQVGKENKCWAMISPVLGRYDGGTLSSDMEEMAGKPAILAIKCPHGHIEPKRMTSGLHPFNA